MYTTKRRTFFKFFANSRLSQTSHRMKTRAEEASRAGGVARTVGIERIVGGVWTADETGAGNLAREVNRIREGLARAGGLVVAAVEA